MSVNHADLARQSSGAGLVILTPDENLPKLKEDLLQCVVDSDDKDISQVLGICEAKGLDFAEVVLVAFPDVLMRGSRLAGSICCKLRLTKASAMRTRRLKHISSSCIQRLPARRVGEQWHQAGGVLHKRGHVARGTRPCIALPLKSVTILEY